uniref:Uncharacterized protein n=1 Tax=Tanacetum cinerariifolium TaxID=118510 RepID=A0A6L2L3H3_TANCI|nr:hypothetical protein [Tanacetum cinerariifolium]
MSRANPQATIASEEQLMPPPISNKPYTKPPTENELLAFIKTLGYDEDPKEKLTSIPHFVATILHQPWRAILGVLNKCLTGKDTSWDRDRHPNHLNTSNTKSRRMKVIKAKLKRNPKQHMSPIRREKEAMAVELAKSVSIEEQRLQHHKIMTQLTTEKQVEKDVEEGYAAERGLKLKEVQACRGEESSAAQDENYKFEDISESNSYATQSSSCSDTDKDDDKDDTEDFDTNIYEDNDKRDDDDGAGFRVFMYNKSQELPKFTPCSLIVTCSSMEDFTNFLHDSPIQELMDLLSKPVFTDAQTTSVVANLERNLEEMFADDADHHILSPPTTTTHDLVTNPQQGSLQEKAKKLMEMINLFTTPPPMTVDDLSEMELKLKFLNKIYKSKSFESHDTHQNLYDLIYESICLDQETIDAQDTEPSFKKRPHDHQDSPNDRMGRKEIKEEMMLVNLLLDLQRLTKLLWIQIKKTLMMNNPKTKKMNIFRNVLTQDGLQRIQGHQMLPKQGNQIGLTYS